MGKFRTVENRFIIPLEAGKLVVREGEDFMLRNKIQAAHRQEFGEESAERAIDRLDGMSAQAGEAVYFLGRKATLHALASFSYLQSPVDSAKRHFDYVRFHRARGAGAVNPEDELAFINAIHEDLRDGLQPHRRRYEKPTWTSVDAGDFARRALYERAGYSHDGKIKNNGELNDEVIMIRSY